MKIRALLLCSFLLMATFSLPRVQAGLWGSRHLVLALDGIPYGLFVKAQSQGKSRSLRISTEAASSEFS
jgi:hypothetical protein